MFMNTPHATQTISRKSVDIDCIYTIFDECVKDSGVFRKWAQTQDGTFSSKDIKEPRGPSDHPVGTGAASIREVITSAEGVRQNPKCRGNAPSPFPTT